MTHTSALSYERWTRLANLATFAIDLQCKRLNTVESQDEQFTFRKWYDFEFLLLALIRLRRIAQQVANLSELTALLSPALREFDASLPGLKRMRDVGEHMDEYAVGRGRHREVDMEMLEVSTLDSDGPTLTWLGTSLNANCALRASEELFRAIEQVGASFTTSV